MELAGLFKVEGGAARLIGSRCESCGAVAFPARQVCGECGGRDLLTKTLTGGGRVVSTTHVVTPPAGFDSPIDVAIVDLQEGPRVFALLTQPAHEGDSVQAVAAPVRGGNAGFAFEPRRKA
jgi:uncharacterized OB-fold protein